MATFNFSPTGDDAGVCGCLNAHHELLRQNKSDIEEWARHIVRECTPTEKGFAPCSPFPVTPTFNPSCVVPCMQANEVHYV